MHEPTTGERSWEVLGQQMLLERQPWLEVYQEQVKLPTGRVLDDFYRVVLPHFAVIVPVTPEGHVVMVRGYKHGVGRVSLSPPAGLLHPGEAAADAARRELLEETGYSAGEWRCLGSYVVDGNRQCGTMHAFLAYNARPAREPEPDDTEDLQVEVLSRARLVESLTRGEFGSLAAMAAVTLALTVGL